MDIVLKHGDLRAVENRRLIHVVPDVDVQSRSSIVLQQVAVRIVLSDSWVEEVQVAHRARPAPT